MTKPVNLNAVKWGQLCDLAEHAAVRLSEDAAAELALRAGRLTTVTAPHSTMADTAMTTAFRWDCVAFGLAPAEQRPVLAPGLLIRSSIVRAILDGRTPDPAAVAERAVAFRPEMQPDPAWMRRADIGGA